MSLARCSLARPLPLLPRGSACRGCSGAPASTETPAQQKLPSYKQTILLPKTSFKSRYSNEQRVKYDQYILQTGKFDTLYNWQRVHNQEPEFVLHDGPPYANGELHMGHAVNKIIKDIANRAQLLQGRKVHYKPGWDCHGLPIELKALERAKIKDDIQQPDPAYVRKVARLFAQSAVEKQRKVFKSWGVMADWEKQCYYTMDKDYVKNQLWQFFKLYTDGLIFRSIKPVYWSPSSRTALAEAELEYDPKHRSTQAYVSFTLDSVPAKIFQFAKGREVSALIWTTTPWTLASNQAICYNPALRYSLVKLQDSSGLHVMCSDLIPSVMEITQRAVDKITEFQGSDLEGATYVNPLKKTSLPLLSAGHVNSTQGTGLVHTAPAHGPDDFLVGLQYKMDVESNVNEQGRFTGLGDWVDGLDVLTSGQEAVLSAIGDKIIHKSDFVHSYPLDWRTKQPVIVRASQQWFIDTGSLKNEALQALKEVKVMPEVNASQYRQGLCSQVERRPYWCISRQRVWGTPIPVLYGSDKPIVHSKIIQRLCELMDKNGTDIWWNCSVEDLVPKSILQGENTTYDDIVKGRDILDIWFDSGLSWSKVLEGRRADVYVEGLDQFTGWFQSSLLTSVALTGRSPYKSIFVHGFVVDEHGRKMSKSIGNVLDPVTITEGGKDKLKQPTYGVDTLRWWVASHATQHTQITISKKLLDDCHSEVLRLRNNLKFLLGSIDDMTSKDFVVPQKIPLLDKYMVHELYVFVNDIAKYYNSFRFNHATKLILHFVSNQISGLYCHSVKDRLYCSPKDSDERRSCQMVLHTTIMILEHALGPVMPNLVEEVWLNHPLYANVPFFETNKIPTYTPEEVPLSSDDSDLMNDILDMKKDLNKRATDEKIDMVILKVIVERNLFDKLVALSNDELCEILQVAGVEVLEAKGESDKKWTLDFEKTNNRQCARCRKFNVHSELDQCSRCLEVLTTIVGK